MPTRPTIILRRLWRDRMGGISVEYAMIAVLLSIVIAATVVLLGDEVGTMLGDLQGGFSG